MKELALDEIKKMFLADLKKHYDQERKKERRAIENLLKSVAKDKPEAAPSLPPEETKDPLRTQSLMVTAEALLDAAIAKHSKQYDPDDGGLTGTVEAVTRKDNFIMTLRFGGSPQVFNSLYQMEKDNNVRVCSAQKALFRDNGDPAPGAAPAPKQQEIKT